jgi:hypothetical protein
VFENTLEHSGLFRKRNPNICTHNPSTYLNFFFENSLTCHVSQNYLLSLTTINNKMTDVIHMKSNLKHSDLKILIYHKMTDFVHTHEIKLGRFFAKKEIKICRHRNNSNTKPTTRRLRYCTIKSRCIT